MTTDIAKERINTGIVLKLSEKGITSDTYAELLDCAKKEALNPENKTKVRDILAVAAEIKEMLELAPTKTTTTIEKRVDYNRYLEQGNGKMTAKITVHNKTNESDIGSSTDSEGANSDDTDEESNK